MFGTPRYAFVSTRQTDLTFLIKRKLSVLSVYWPHWLLFKYALMHFYAVNNQYVCTECTCTYNTNEFFFGVYSIYISFGQTIIALTLHLLQTRLPPLLKRWAHGKPAYMQWLGHQVAVTCYVHACFYMLWIIFNYTTTVWVKYLCSWKRDSTGQIYGVIIQSTTVCDTLVPLSYIIHLHQLTTP